MADSINKAKARRSKHNAPKHLRQTERTAANKLRRINRERAKANKPPIDTLPYTIDGKPHAMTRKRAQALAEMQSGLR